MTMPCQSAFPFQGAARKACRPRALRLLRGVTVATALMSVLLAQAAGPNWQVAGGDARRGAELISRFGCAACHTVPGVSGAHGTVGPPLDHFAARVYIAGILPNTPPNLVHWIRDPQGVVPGNAMPNMGVTEAQARDIAAYLYKQR